VRVNVGVGRDRLRGANPSTRLARPRTGNAASARRRDGGDCPHAAGVKHVRPGQRPVYMIAKK
jgi:hypothetical protein